MSRLWLTIPGVTLEKGQPQDYRWWRKKSAKSFKTYNKMNVCKQFPFVELLKNTRRSSTIPWWPKPDRNMSPYLIVVLSWRLMTSDILVNMISGCHQDNTWPMLSYTEWSPKAHFVNDTNDPHLSVTNYLTSRTVCLIILNYGHYK